VTQAAVARVSARRPAVAVLAAEWTKLRTLRSTGWTLGLTLLLSVGLAVLIGVTFRTTFATLPRQQQEHFDPLFATFYGLTLSQLPLVVYAVLVVTGEYRSGTIRASLAAVPRRGRFYAGKLVAATLPVVALAVVTVPVMFLAAQAALGPHRTSLGAPGVPQAVAGACLYLPLIALFAMGVAAMLRSSVGALALLLPLLFLGSQGLGNIPKARAVTQYLPDQAAMVVMHLASPPSDPRFGRDYGPWTGMAILAVWTAAALLGGYLVLRRRDA
jgi:ABC-type transport system involved in multi-copper enzyme maturation permease subunit